MCVCVIMFILSGRCLGIYSQMGGDRLLKFSLTISTTLKPAFSQLLTGTSKNAKYVFLLLFILLQDTVSVETQTEDFLLTRALRYTEKG